MTKPTLHLLGLAHTQTTNAYSHCAFTGKVKRFAPMLQSVGYEVIHYGVEGGDSGAKQNVDILTYDEWNQMRSELLYAKYNRVVEPTDFIGDLAATDNILYRAFNGRLRNILRDTVKPKDIICLPFGHAHQEAVHDLPIQKVETGIGYPISCEQFRVYESFAWYHYQAGKENRTGNDYHWVIPNYFDTSEWDFNPTPQDYLLYFGRLTEIKGLPIVWEIAKHKPNLKVIICGQGDPTPYLTLPNIEYHPPVHGRDRSGLLGNAAAVIMPTRYVEPFGGVTVEAQMTGTPVLGSTYGSFTETIVEGFNGYRCHTLGEFLQGIDNILAGKLDRQKISEYAKSKYDMYVLAHDYNKVIRQMTDLHDKGWYTQNHDSTH